MESVRFFSIVASLYILFALAVLLTTPKEYEVECAKCGAKTTSPSPEKPESCPQCPQGLCVEGMALFLVSKERPEFEQKYNEHLIECEICNDSMVRSDNDSP